MNQFILGDVEMANLLKENSSTAKRGNFQIISNKKKKTQFEIFILSSMHALF